MTDYAQRITSLRIKSTVNLQPGRRNSLRMNLITGHKLLFAGVLLNSVGAEDALLQLRQPVRALARRSSDVPGQRRVWGLLVSLLFCLRSLTWTLAKHQTNSAFAIKPFIPSPTDSAAAVSLLHLCGCFMGGAGSVGLLPTAWGQLAGAFCDGF